ncbi:MAG TPA: DUF1318 domain-containing protein [Candidatus Omnitrophota bacterium]|nr:DUF1318 domain-containing protein [Candidatus Omnitrophota bacterium]HPS37546.1 DUF1318 domain-containing protein [Candidatus Omnitrophota bacterium]
MKRSGFFIPIFLIASFMIASACFAGQYDLKQITPEIDQALKGRQARYARLQSLKQQGLVGENSRGYVTELKGGAAAGEVVASENRDRKVIYHALVGQNALGPNGMREVENVFADVQREKALSGEMIEASSGNWVRKS